MSVSGEHLGHVDLSEVRIMLAAATDRCNQLDRAPIPENHRDRVKAQAESQRLLLFLAHLCGKAQTLVLDEYHSLRGFSDHVIPSEESP